MNQFEPFWWCRGGHRMTLLAWSRPRRFASLPRGERRFFSVRDGTYVLADCHWQPEPGEHPALLLLHGLEGSSRSHYVRGMADKAWRRGFNVIRLNQRNCGGTEHLTRGLYHSGLTADARAVVEELIERDRVPAIAVAGYSLGGNLALKLAGEYGPDAPPSLACVCAVSPPIDLTEATALLERRVNLLYQWNFVWNLKRRIQRKRAVFPELYSTRGLRRIRTVRAFDDRFTAPHNGFRDAADYYSRAGAINVISRIAVPTLIISALDDPFIPAAPFRDPRVTSNPNIDVVLTPHGGHCGFVGRPCADHDGYWAEWKIVQFVQDVLKARRNAEGEADEERKAG
jgi:predicted alpha/beta-fold hydrolase